LDGIIRPPGGHLRDLSVREVVRVFVTTWEHQDVEAGDAKKIAA